MINFLRKEFIHIFIFNLHDFLKTEGPLLSYTFFHVPLSGWPVPAHSLPEVLSDVRTFLPGEQQTQFNSTKCA